MGTPDEVAEEDVEAGDKVEDNVGVEEETEDPDPHRRVPKEEVKETVKIRLKEEEDLTLATRLNVIQTHHHSRRVFVTGPLEKVLIFVWNQEPVPGRTSMYQNPTNETMTSSAKIVTTNYKICCITRNCQKYIH